MTPFRLVSASLVVLLLAAPGRPQEEKEQEKKGNTVARLVAGTGAAPDFDGKLDDPCWAKAGRFELTRGKEVQGFGYLLRVRRQLYIGLRSEFAALNLGFRFNFRNPVTQVRMQVMLVPLSPPRPPVIAYRDPAESPAERISAASCDARFDFSPEQGFTAELRVPLDLVEIGRNAREYGFSVELWELTSGKPLAVYPLEGAYVASGEARLSSVPHWGSDVSAAEPAMPVSDGIRLLEQVEVEQRGRKDGEIVSEDVLFAFLGWKDGRRRDGPLARIQERLEKAIASRPGYASLRAALVWTYLGRGRAEAALKVQEEMARDYPLLKLIIRHALIRSEILRGLGRYDDAIATMKQYKKYLEEKPVARREFAVLQLLKDGWRIEEKLRAEEAQRDDLPRVRLSIVTAAGKPRGEILLELFEDDAPNSVANFISLVESGLYDGTRFHWVEGSRRLFGGDPDSKDDETHNDGMGGPGYEIESEPSRRQNFPYTIAFTDKRGLRRTEGSVFLLSVQPLPSLDGLNSVFGRVIEGFDVVRRVDYYDVLAKAEVVRKRDHEYVPVKR